jgi:hypothetical protein
MFGLCAGDRWNVILPYTTSHYVILPHTTLYYLVLPYTTLYYLVRICRAFLCAVVLGLGFRSPLRIVSKTDCNGISICAGMPSCERKKIFCTKTHYQECVLSSDILFVQTNGLFFCQGLNSPEVAYRSCRRPCHSSAC